MFRLIKEKSLYQKTCGRLLILSSTNFNSDYGGDMLIGEPLPFVKDFIEKINEEIEKHKPENVLSRLQMYWIGFCIVRIFMTDTVCRAKYERAGLGKYTASALSQMFRHSGIPWDILLYSSLKYIFRKYGITEGVLAIDDTEKQRSKKNQKNSQGS